VTAQTASKCAWAGLLTCALALPSCGGADEAFPAPPAAPSAVVQPFAISVRPAGLMGGEDAVATITLTLAAGSGGATVQLSSSDNVAVIPQSVVVPAGAVTASVPISTRAVPADTSVLLRAAASGRTVEDTLSVWAVVPDFFSWHSDTGDWVGQGGTLRLVSGRAQFSAVCDGNRIRVNVDPGHWSAEFSGPQGTRLRVGTYENAAQSPFAGASPGMSVGGDGRGCGRVDGRFVVREFELSPVGEVRQFWVTFEQRCDGTAPRLVGDVRVTAPALSPGIVKSCVK